jgi:Flp pilus assembly pilin Flp
MTFITKNTKSSRNLLRDERGLSTIEYVILMAIVVIGAVGVWNEIGEHFKGQLGSAKENVLLIGGDEDK